MSANARERAAARRARRRGRADQAQRGNRAERAARDSGAAAAPDPSEEELAAELASEESPPADHPVTDAHDSSDDDDPEITDQPAEPTVSDNREQLTITLRRRDRKFLEALAIHWDCTAEQAVDRLVRQAHVKMRASTGDTMRYEEFSSGQRQPETE